MRVPAPPLTRGFSRLVFLAAALGLLTMPVEYRGGAKEAHPHAVVQFWAEAGRGSLDHHHRDGSHHHEFRGTGEKTAGATAYRAIGEAVFPRLSEATSAQKYAPIAVSLAGAVFTVVLSTRVSRRGIGIVWLTGSNPAPHTPPPRLALLT